MHEHWTEDEREALKAASTFEETAEVAVAILARMKSLGQPIIQICGPMSTGGLGNLQRNMVSGLGIPTGEYPVEWLNGNGGKSCS